MWVQRGPSACADYFLSRTISLSLIKSGEQHIEVSFQGISVFSGWTWGCQEWPRSFLHLFLVFSEVGSNINHLQTKDNSAKAIICPINLMYPRKSDSEHSFLPGSMLIQQSNLRKCVKSQDAFCRDWNFIMISPI